MTSHPLQCDCYVLSILLQVFKYCPVFHSSLSQQLNFVRCAVIYINNQCDVMLYHEVQMMYRIVSYRIVQYGIVWRSEDSDRKQDKEKFRDLFLKSAHNEVIKSITTICMTKNIHKFGEIIMYDQPVSHLFKELVEEDSWDMRILLKFLSFCVKASTTFKCVNISTTATVFVEENSGSIVESSSACIATSF